MIAFYRLPTFICLARNENLSWVLANKRLKKICGAIGEEWQCDNALLHSEAFGLSHLERTMTVTATDSMAAIATMVDQRTLIMIIATIAMTI